jgi:transcriptional regulator with XRE-family HTH domain
MDYQELGQQVALLRKQQKLTQQQLADYCGLSRATLNALENGRPGDVGTRKLIKILDLLGYELRLREKSPFPTLEELRDAQL